MQSRFTVTYTPKGDHTQFNSSSVTAALLSICVWIPPQRCLSWRLVVLKLWHYIWASVTASLRISLYKLTVIPVVIPLQFTKSSKHCDSSVMCNGVKHLKFDICICFGAETLQINERFLINCKLIEYFKENSALCGTPLSSGHLLLVARSDLDPLSSIKFSDGRRERRDWFNSLMNWLDG